MSADPLLERVNRALAHRYAVTRELGAGGMGTVYLATDRTLGRDVAIKALPPSTRVDSPPENALPAFRASSPTTGRRWPTRASAARGPWPRNR